MTLDLLALLAVIAFLAWDAYRDHKRTEALHGRLEAVIHGRKEDV
jgi:hypothetical protein